MFSSVYQNGEYGIEIFSPSGNEPFKICRLNNESNIKKVYDRTIKGYMAALEKEGVTTSMQIPRSSKSTLGITQPLLVIQMQLHPEKGFSMELILLDSGRHRRRFLLSTNFKDVDSNNLHVSIPWVQPDREDWTNVAINLSDLVSRYSASTSGVSYVSLESFTIQPVCRIRKIFTLPIKYLGDEDTGLLIPPKYDFTTGVEANGWVFSFGGGGGGGLERMTGKAENVAAAADAGGKEPNGLGIVGKKLPRREQGATAKALSNVTTIGAAAVDGAANKRHKPTPEVTQGKEAATAVSSIVQEAPAQVMPVVPAALFTALPSSAPKFSGKLKQKLIGAGGVHSVVPTLIPVTAAPPVAEAPSNSHTSAVSTAEAVQDVIALPPSQAQSHSQSPPRSQEQDHRIEATGEPLNPHNPSQHRQSMEEEDLRQSMQDYSAIDDFVANYSTIAPTLPVTKSMNMDLDMDVTQLAAKLHNTTTTPVTKGKAPARQQQREDLRISALRNTSDYPVPVRPARVLVDAAVSPMPASYLPAPPTHASGDFPSTDLGAQGVLLFEDDADSGNNTHAGVLPMEPFKGNSAGETIDPRTVEMCMDTGESESEYPPQQSIEEIIAAHRKPPTPPGTPPIMPATAGSIPRPHSAIPSAVRSGVSSTTTSSAVGADGASRGVPPRRPSTGGTTASRDGELHHPSILTPGLVALPHPASPVLTHRTVSHSNSTTASLFSPADMKPTEEPELMPPSLPMPSISFVDDEPEQQPEPKAHIPVHQNTVSSTERNPLLSPFSDAVAYFEARRSQQQQGDTTGRSGSLRSARTSRNSSLHNSMTAASASPSSSRGDGAGADGENQFKSSSANQARASSAASGMEDLDYNGQNEDPNQQDQHHSEMYDDSQSDFAVYKARSSDISVTWQTEIDSLLDRLQPSAQPALSSMASDTSTSRRSSTSSAVAGGQLSSPAPQLPPSSGAPTPLPEKKKRAIRARVANLLKQVEEAEMEYIAEFGFDAFEKDVGFFEENLPFRRQ